LQRAALIGTRAGEYEITGVLGQGGMGTVYSGVHPVIGTRVAIKVLDPRLSDPSVVVRFIREAQVVNKIRHPNIIEIFAFGESPDLGHYFVMPLLEGDTLAARVEKGGALAPLAALPILEHVAEALDAAHEAGVCHRDLKPENVVLADDGRGQEMVKVLDFGLAKLSDGTSVNVTSEKFSMGTPLYMSPEQWAAVGSVDHRTDIYALGVVLHFMLTGRHPFEGDTPVSLMKMHTTEPPTLPSQQGGPAGFDGVIARALAKDREERFQKASELHAAFAAACAGEAVEATSGSKNRGQVALAVTAHAGTTTGTASAPPRRVLLLAAVTLAAVIAAVIALVVHGRRSRETPDRPHARAPGAATAPPAPAPEPAAISSPDAGPTRAAEKSPAPDKRRRPATGHRPKRSTVHSTWGKTDDPF
jgi:serine/threonine-protein kinase